MSGNKNQFIWDSRKIKVLIDGRQATGFASGDFINIDSKGIKLIFSAMSNTLADIDRNVPKALKIIYVDPSTTIEIDMKINGMKLPSKLGDGVPVVDVTFVGEYHIRISWSRKE